MSPPATTRATIPRPYLPVSTARPMTRHPLDASTGTRPSIKPQRPDPVTGRQDNGTNSGRAATCPITDNSVTYSHQCILFHCSMFDIFMSTRTVCPNHIRGYERTGRYTVVCVIYIFWHWRLLFFAIGQIAIFVGICHVIVWDHPMTWHWYSGAR